MEVMWEEPAWAALFRRLAEFSRLVLFDRRGCGVSDRGGTTVTPTLEERMEDVVAVLDAVESERAALFGFSEGGTVAALFAATYPERTSGVILYGTLARIIRDADHPWGWFTEEEFADFVERVSRGWGLRSAAPGAVELWAPSVAGDERFADWFAKFARQSLSRRDVVPFIRSIAAYDLVDVFPAVRVPTMVLHRTGDVLVPVSHARWLAQQIPAARLVELPGVDHLPFVGDAEGVAAEIEAFLLGPRVSEPRGRRLLTIVVTDIAHAASTMTRLGDQAWRELLAAHDHEVDEHLARFGGRRVKYLGDGCLAVFDGPARAIRCAVGIVDAAARLGLRVRAGLHCGECETADDDVRGIAVHVAARVTDLAAPGEVLVSATVRDLVAGSGIRFGPGRDIELQGLPGRRTVLPVLAKGATPDDIRRLAIDQANVLRRDGEYWTVAYDGTVATLRDSKGLRDLARRPRTRAPRPGPGHTTRPRGRGDLAPSGRRCRAPPRGGHRRADHRQDGTHRLPPAAHRTRTGRRRRPDTRRRGRRRTGPSGARRARRPARSGIRARRPTPPHRRSRRTSTQDRLPTHPHHPAPHRPRPPRARPAPARIATHRRVLQLPARTRPALDNRTLMRMPKPTKQPTPQVLLLRTTLR